MESYFNTVNLIGAELKAAVNKAKFQEAGILLLFKHKTKLTASETWGYYSALKSSHVPLTSCRRAITNLMNKGKLIKTNEKKIGMYGSPEYYYKVV